MPHSSKATQAFQQTQGTPLPVSEAVVDSVTLTSQSADISDSSIKLHVSEIVEGALPSRSSKENYVEAEAMVLEDGANLYTAQSVVIPYSNGGIPLSNRSFDVTSEVKGQPSREMSPMQPALKLHGNDTSSIALSLGCRGMAPSPPQQQQQQKRQPLAVPSLNQAQGKTSPAQHLAEVTASQTVCFHPTLLQPLLNLGNTCYFNSGVQLLANCPLFVYGILHTAVTSFQKPGSTSSSAINAPASNRTAATLLCKSGGPVSHRVLMEFAGLLGHMNHPPTASDRSISPIRVVDALATAYPQFEGRSQQDCAEMINAVLATMEDEGCLQANVKELLRSFEKDAQAKVAATPTTVTVTAPKKALPSTASDEGVSEPYGMEDYSLSSPVPTLSLPGASSAHVTTALRLMDNINEDNENLERLVAQRKGKPYQGNFCPPRLHYNPIVDGYRGFSLSEVECHHCHGVSRMVSSFSTLLLDLPSARQRRRFATAHPNVRRLSPSGEPLHTKKKSSINWKNPFSVLMVFLRSIWSLFADSIAYPLTLQECLDIHFEPVVLRGSNQYHCESCGSVVEATKAEKLLLLPEYLLVHMKRFEAGNCFYSKKTEPLLFPISWDSLTPEQAKKKQWTGGALPEVLDLRSYLHSSMLPYAEPIPECLRASLESTTSGPLPCSPLSAAANTPSSGKRSVSRPVAPITTATAAATEPAAENGVPTTYTLDSVINHHGSYGGGHYSVFLHKEVDGTRIWLYISDDEVLRASVEEVANSEEYVLLYRRQPLVHNENSTREELRRKARYYLLQDSEAELPLDESVYISRMWLQRVAFLQDPGPIINQLCYCRAEELSKVSMHKTLFPADVRVPEDVPHVHGPPVEWFYIPISPADYDAFFDAYGGNWYVTNSQYQELKMQQRQFMGSLSSRRSQHS